MTQVRPMVVIPDDINGAYAAAASLSRLRNFAEVNIHPTRPNDEADLTDRVRESDVILSFRPAFTRFPSALISACPHLKLICISGTGVEDIDVAQANSKRIAVANVVGSANQSVAELCVAFMFSLARRLSEQDTSVRTGTWQGRSGFELSGKTLGILGLGGISRELIRMARGLGMNVISWSRNNDSARAHEAGTEAVSLENLLQRSDIVSLHLRLHAETHSFLNASRIAQMKPGALLINTARGGLVDEAALVAALQSGHLGGAGLDVFAVEPLPADSPLKTYTNVIMTPVSGWNTRESSQRMIDISIENVVGFLTKNPQNIVNKEAL
jgi:glycerate dehydrogenase